MSDKHRFSNRKSLTIFWHQETIYKKPLLVSQFTRKYLIPVKINVFSHLNNSVEEKIFEFLQQY
jgi:hypothetical protein